MRIYALWVTAALTGLITTELMLALTRADIIETLFVSLMSAVIAAAAFVVATEPRKKKAHWEKAGGLDVMIMKGGKK